MADAQQPVFNIEKLYVKDLSVEVPNAPAIFLEREAPQMDVQMSTDSRMLSDGMYHTSITVTITAKSGDKTMFLVECSQAGIFRIQNVPQDSIHPVLMIECPRLLFPFAREIVATSVRNGGFPPLMLDPIDFVALYQQQMSQQTPQSVPAA
jgi:preprotein translocase subunit SecB